MSKEVFSMEAINTVTDGDGDHLPGSKFKCYSKKERDVLIGVGAAKEAESEEEAAKKAEEARKEEEARKKAEEDKKAAEEAAARKEAAAKKSPGERAPEILEAMKLVRAEGKNLTADGRPTVEAVEEILGYDISAEERDNLMDEMEKKN